MTSPPATSDRPTRAANLPYRLPPALFDARCRVCWFTAGLLLLVAASFASLSLQWSAFFSGEAARSMARFVGEFFPPDLSRPFLLKVLTGAWETLAMSAVGTLLAAFGGLVLALPASAPDRGLQAGGRRLARFLLNALRSVPELVWAGLLIIAAGLGPLAGTLALGLHTTGVLGRLFAEAIENAPDGPSDTLRLQGAGRVQVFLYATLPQTLPQIVSYTLYRWENNIRAAAVLGVVGAGGLGQLLAFHMGLFHMDKTATVLGAMLLLVAAVDGLSVLLRKWWSR
ncbi:MAG: phosphonate ABC transporter, permease protein PhnE [Burkholderiaceae bacterium]